MQPKYIKTSFFLVFALLVTMAANLANTCTTAEGIANLLEQVEKYSSENKDTNTKRFLISSSNFVNAQNNLSEPFALELTEKITGQFQNKNYKTWFASSENLKFNGWEIDGQWRPLGTKTSVKLQATLWKDGKEETSLSSAFSLDTSAPENKALYAPHDANTWGRSIINKLRLEVDRGAAHKIKIKLFERVGDTPKNAAAAITNWMQHFVKHSNTFLLTSTYEELTNADIKTLQERLDNKGFTKNPSLSLILADVSLELRAKVEKKDDVVFIFASIVNGKGQQSNIVSVELKQNLIPTPLLKTATIKETYYGDLLPKKGETKNGLKISLASNKDMGKTIYNGYEDKRFFMSPNHDAYVYLFALPKEEDVAKHVAFLLYPEKTEPVLVKKGKLVSFSAKNIPGQNSSKTLSTNIDIVAIASEEIIRVSLDGISDIAEYRRFLRRALEKSRRNHTGYAEMTIPIIVRKERN